MKKISYVVFFLSLIGTCIVYPYLPTNIPIHWNLKGQIDSNGHKALIFLITLLPVFLYVLMSILRRLTPNSNSNKTNEKVYDISIFVSILIFVGLNWALILFGLGYKFEFVGLTRLIAGIVFIILGNYMTVVRQNVFFGVRTPWTLNNEEVWRRTNRVGGYAFVIAGIITIVSFFFKGMLGFLIMVISLIAVAVFLCVYSYHLYKRITQGQNLK